MDSPATEIHPAVAPAPGDLVVIKRRVSAFTGSDLEVGLRGLGEGTLVLTGIATSGLVLSTLRQAADLDYRLIVLADRVPRRRPGGAPGPDSRRSSPARPTVDGRAVGGPAGRR